MKPAIGLCVLSIATAPLPTRAQRKPDRGQPFSRTAQSQARTETVAFHNSYTGGTVSAELRLPAREPALAAAVIVAGPTRREQLALTGLRRQLSEAGYASLTLAPIALSGATEDDSLNTIAAVHYLEARRELRGAPIGILGYGEGVRLASVAAGAGNPAAFLALLGGAVVPDKLNVVPETLVRGALPKDGAAASLQHVRCPVLVLVGEYDRQGTHRNAAENAQTLRQFLDAGKNQNYTIKLVNDSDDLLAETGPGGSPASATAVPPAAVWKLATDWLARQVHATDPGAAADDVVATPNKPVRLYPKSVYGPFQFRPGMVWQPGIGGQNRPFGFWYW